jgi:tetratricopeptide (TPR) repeat protein
MFGNRYAYFPMMGLAASVLGFGFGLHAPGNLAPLLHRTAPVLLPAVVGIAALFTAGEASLWRDEPTLFGADLRSDPQDARALYHYGHAIVGRDGCVEALPYFESATRYEPGYGRAWHNTAGCLVNLGRYREALPAALTAWKLQPNEAGAAYNLAVVELATGHPEQGVDLLQAALRIDPQHAGARRLAEKLTPPAAPSSP